MDYTVNHIYSVHQMVETPGFFARSTLDSVALTTTELKSVLKTSVNFEWRNISSKVLERLQFSSGSRTFDTIIVYRTFQ